MRFGVFIPQGWYLDLVGIEPENQWATMRALIQHVDRDLAFTSAWVYDHFHTVPVPTDEATHEAWTLMSAFAASTQRLRLGQMTTCISYRNPAYLAKVAATVDAISGGRVEMSAGAGWYEHEWRAYGYGFPSVSERLGRLDEGVQIMQQLWRAGKASLEGKYYQVDGAICRPVPLQEGGIPLWVAGGGEKKTLRIAAKFAQYSNFDGSEEGFAQKSRILAEHCREIGRDFEEIVRSADYRVVIGATEADVKDRLASIHDHYQPFVPPDRLSILDEQVASGPLVGTPEQIVEKLQAMNALGMTYAITYFSEAAYDRSGVDMFSREVIPALA
jgi:F420-dependent oxidoreductase-like protein